MKQEIFAKRRNALMTCLPKNSIAFIPAATEQIRNKDTDYPFRQNSDFYYLTGYPEPNAVAILMPGHSEAEYILFNMPKDPAAEQWTGHRIGEEDACTLYGAQKAYPIQTLMEHLPSLLQDHDVVVYPLGTHSTLEKQVIQTIVSLEKKTRTGVRAPESLMRLSFFLHELRLYKSPEEILLLKKAIEISAQAHIRAMQFCRPGLKEYELEAEILHVFVAAGARFPAYGTIVAGGKNACVLHYTENNDALKDRELLLIDAGAEYHFYAGDITRTFPINGRFTEVQKALYEVVLHAQTQALLHAKPNHHWLEPHEAAVKTLTEGLVELHILEGKVEDLIAQEAYKPYYMHRTGHWLGMDVHDVGDYQQKNHWRMLEPGMVFTVEPGLYIHPSEKVDPKWWNIGIRIEDNVLITEQGHEILSHQAPKQIDEIEQVMR